MFTCGGSDGKERIEQPYLRDGLALPTKQNKNQGGKKKLDSKQRAANFLCGILYKSLQRGIDSLFKLDCNWILKERKFI